MNIITQTHTIVQPKIELYNMDCMKYMVNCKDNEFDLAIVDPPYGISIDNNKKENFVMTKHKSKGWDDERPNEEYFKELFRVSKNQIIWGGNYFPLPLKKGWICWDKVNPLIGKFSDFELAWTSLLNCDRIYKQEWIGFGRKFIEKEASIHPTQKPKRLYEWILKNFGETGNKILDTHLGSGSSAIASHNYKFDFVGLEIDKEYFDGAVKRFNNYKSQLKMF
jgi:site-specific DNA-methyltransferase (adenine-specific)